MAAGKKEHLILQGAPRTLSKGWNELGCGLMEEENCQIGEQERIFKIEGTACKRT